MIIHLMVISTTQLFWIKAENFLSTLSFFEKELNDTYFIRTRFQSSFQSYIETHIDTYLLFFI